MKLPYKPVRFLMALILPPLIATLIVIPFFAAFGNPDAIVTAALFTLMFGAIIGLPTMIVFGLPIHAFLCKRGKRETYAYAILGAIAGTVAGFIAPNIIFGFNLEFGVLNVMMSAFALPTGAIAAALFHNIRGPHKPLTQPPNLPT